MQELVLENSTPYSVSILVWQTPRHTRTRPGHPRLQNLDARKTLVPATSAGMTAEGGGDGGGLGPIRGAGTGMPG